MAKPARSAWECSACGHTVSKWVGRCPGCGEWGTMSETAPVVVAKGGPVRTAPRVSVNPALSITNVPAEPAKHRPTGVGEFDRVLGGGLVPGGVVLLAGEPGVGKSTLLLEVAHKWAAAPGGGPALIATGEESASQVRMRADRLGALHPDLMLAAETDLAAVLGHLDDIKPGLLILDSVQTVSTTEVEGVPGGVTQVRAVAAQLIAVAKARGMATVLVGHVTKEGTIAGPRVLEHLVDTVAHFEGDRHSALRLLRGVKNRFGPADEVGCFEMTETGVVSLPDPGGLFLTEIAEPVPGTCVTVTMEGRRAMLVEVQALVGGSAKEGVVPRRTVSGLDGARLNMVLAVLHRRSGKKVLDREVYAATVGGMRVTEPAADLAVALAVSSSVSEAPVSADIVAIGEVGLTGEIRRVTAVPRRLAEAARLGFKHAIVPRGCGNEAPKGMTVSEAGSVDEALRLSAMRWAGRG